MGVKKKTTVAWNHYTAYDYNDVRDFKLFNWTGGSIFKCIATKMKLPKNIKKLIFQQKFCV